MSSPSLDADYQQCLLFLSGEMNADDARQFSARLADDDALATRLGTVAEDMAWVSQLAQASGTLSLTTSPLPSSTLARPPRRDNHVPLPDATTTPSRRGEPPMAAADSTRQSGHLQRRVLGLAAIAAGILLLLGGSLFIRGQQPGADTLADASTVIERGDQNTPSAGNAEVDFSTAIAWAQQIQDSDNDLHDEAENVVFDPLDGDLSDDTVSDSTTLTTSDEPPTWLVAAFESLPQDSLDDIDAAMSIDALNADATTTPVNDGAIDIRATGVRG